VKDALHAILIGLVLSWILIAALVIISNFYR
jgi:hypothetical protein